MQQILVILTLIAILITKERAVKSNQELIVEEKVIQSLGLRNLWSFQRKGLLFFVTDAFTSGMSSNLFEKKVWHCNDRYRDQITASQKSHICRTCSSSFKKSQIPIQAVSNMLKVFSVPNELRKLNKLEHGLISWRILFQKVAIMSKNCFPKLKGSIPIHANGITNILP